MNDIKYLDYWNKLYDSKFYFGTGPTKLAKKAESFLQESKVKTILELGCGQGRDAIHFAQLGYDVSALDISQKAIKSIEKVKVKLERTDSISAKDKLTNELLNQEEKNRQFEISIQEIEKKICTLKNKTIKIKGQRLISDLINRLSYMNLKWERSRQIEVTDIYKNL